MKTLNLFIAMAFLTSLDAQKATLCPCKSVWLTLAPDSTVIHPNLPLQEINTSYISWNRFLALGGSGGYPENDTIFDSPNNFSMYDFGCPGTIVYDKHTHKRFTGELVFTFDERERGGKDFVLQRTQIVDGLKDGYEITFGIDSESRCYFPRVLGFFKQGMIYKKVYAFEYFDKRLLMKQMDSYNNEGRLYGETKSFDNGLVFPQNGKSYQNKERIQYEAFILKFPSSSCGDFSQELFGNGLSSLYSVTDKNVVFDGHRVQFDPEDGQIRWEEQWQNEQLLYRKEYYNSPSECPSKKGLLQAHTTFKYFENGEFQQDVIKYFPDCRSSVKEKYSTINHYPLTDSYEIYSAPGKIKERGAYDLEGRKNGVWEFYSDEGTIEKRTTYKNNEENGIEEIFDKKGNLFRKLRYDHGQVVEIIK